MAEAHNAAGNDAFNAGDFSKASDLYFAAVKANGTVAKYRTNLCNALLKCGRAAMAVEEAAAAIAVDGTWSKGYYYKAVALEELGEIARALAACEEGLHIHRWSRGGVLLLRVLGC
jgi:tetratricopeptide (TPR) repeat protein